MAVLVYDAAVDYDDPYWTYEGASVVPAPPATSVNAAIVSALRAVPGYLAAAESAMQSILRTVPGILGVTWYYRKLNSGPIAQTRTYDPQVSVILHVSGRRTREEFDENGKVVRRVEDAQVRMSDAIDDLHQGDQLIDNDGQNWAVMGIASSGYGTKAYALERTIPLKAGPNRGGGV